MSLFFLGGGAQFVIFCSLDPFCCSSFVFSFRVFCPRGLSALRAASFSGSCARVHVVWSSSLIRRRYLTFADPSSCCCNTAKQRFILVFPGWSVSPTHEAGLLPSPRLAGCLLRVRRGQPVLGRHRPVSNLCGDLWPSLQSGQTHLPASHSVSTGGVTRRSAPSQLCGLALLTR